MSKEREIKIYIIDSNNIMWQNSMYGLTLEFIFSLYAYVKNAIKNMLI